MKVSLILTTYNSKENLIGTLKSIESQDYPYIEVVIKDGQSTDGTLDIIKDYAKTRKNVIWKSTPDTGIFDAMNQGYEMSSGAIIAFFNDKFICDNAVSKFVNAIKNGGQACMGAHSDLVYATEEKVVRYWRMGEGKISKGWMPGHPTLYLKREVYEKYGLYDTKYKVSADYDFMVRILKDNQTRLVYIPEVLISMYYGGTSTNNIGSYLLSISEAHDSLKKNKIRYAWVVTFRRTLKVLGQFRNVKRI